MPSWLSEPGSRRGKGRLESGPARLWRTSKLERRLILLFGVKGGKSDGERSGGGDEGGEVVLAVRGRRGVRWR